MLETLIAENARIAQNQQAYQEKYKSLAERYEAAKYRYEKVDAQITERQKRAQMVEAFINTLDAAKPLTTFDEGLWGSLLECMTVYGKEDVKVQFKA